LIRHCLGWVKASQVANPRNAFCIEQRASSKEKTKTQVACLWIVSAAPPTQPGWVHCMYAHSFSQNFAFAATVLKRVRSSHLSSAHMAFWLAQVDGCLDDPPQTSRYRSRLAANLV
jgi:hypothetical protein